MWPIRFIKDHEQYTAGQVVNLELKEAAKYMKAKVARRAKTISKPCGCKGNDAAK